MTCASRAERRVLEDLGSTLLTVSGPYTLDSTVSFSAPYVDVSCSIDVRHSILQSQSGRSLSFSWLTRDSSRSRDSYGLLSEMIRRLSWCRQWDFTTNRYGTGMTRHDYMRYIAEISEHPRCRTDQHGQRTDGPWTDKFVAGSRCVVISRISPCSIKIKNWFSFVTTSNFTMLLWFDLIDLTSFQSSPDPKISSERLECRHNTWTLRATALSHTISFLNFSLKIVFTLFTGENLPMGNIIMLDCLGFSPVNLSGFWFNSAGFSIA